MRWPVALVLLAGCRAIFGLDPPTHQAIDASGTDSADGRSIDAAPIATCADANLVACFDFENSITDAAPSPNAVTASNFAFDMGKNGQAIVLNDTSRMIVQDSILLDVPAVTIEAWIFMAMPPAAGGREGVFDVEGQYAMFVKDGGALQCTAGSQIEIGSIPLDQWTHVACTAGGNAQSVYVNGVIVAAVPFNGSLATASTAGGEIGGNSPDGTSRFVGKIDQLRVYRTARTGVEICMDAGRTGC